MSNDTRTPGEDRKAELDRTTANLNRSLGGQPTPIVQPAPTSTPINTGGWSAGVAATEKE